MKQLVRLATVLLFVAGALVVCAEPVVTEPASVASTSEILKQGNPEDIASMDAVTTSPETTASAASGAIASSPVVNAGPEANASDAILVLIQKKLPAGWKMLIASDTLTFERAGDIWVMNVNRINAEPKLEFPKERQAIIKSQGKKTQARMVFKMTPRLTLEQMAVLDTENAKIDVEIASLPEKLGISGFLDVELSRKVGPVYTATAPEDVKRVEEYQKLREELSSKRLK
ncbi:MAG TPA: hypothetical protein PKO06_12535, partial [Candidatus Ozemobacteraceae bacterium]|nr:hypothetical protein [Candidatus Ozemobacteraceae bacterium]